MVAKAATSLALRLTGEPAPTPTKRRTGNPGPGDSVELPPYAYDEGLAAHEAHSLYPIVRRCIDLRAEFLARRRLRFYQGFDEQRTEIVRKRGNIVDVWMKSNPFNLVEQLQVSLDGNGNGYLVIEENKLDQVTGFYTLPAHRVQPLLARDGKEIAAYRLHHRGRQYDYDADQIMHVMSYAPGLSISGISLMKAAALSWKTGRQTGLLLKEVVQRGGEFSFVLVSADGRTGASVQDPAKRRRLNLQMKKRWSTPHGRRRIMAVPTGVKIEKTMLTPRELELPKLMKMSDSDIAMVFGIPLWKLGLMESTGMGGGGAALSQERMFVEDTGASCACRLEDALTFGLLQRFDESWSCEFDLSDLHVSKMTVAEHGTALLAFVDKTITVNEWREEMGWEPMDEEFNKIRGALEIATATAEIAAKAGNTAPDAGEKKQAAAIAPKKRVHKPPFTREHLEERGRHLGRQMELEAKHALPYVIRLLNQQESRLVARMLSEGVASWASKRAVDATMLLAETDEDRAIVLAMFEDLVERRGLDALNEVTQKLDFDLHSARAGTWISRRRDRMLANTTEFTRELVRDQLAEQAGESMEGLVAIVRGVFDDRRENAITIARTESASAFNFASLEAWKQTNGMVKSKVYVAVLDENTRETHAEANGQVVPIEEPFQVGGLLCDVPGDTGDPNEDINCRCAMDFVLDEDRGVRKILDFINRAMRKQNPAHPSRNGNGHAKRVLAGR